MKKILFRNPQMCVCVRACVRVCCVCSMQGKNRYKVRNCPAQRRNSQSPEKREGKKRERKEFYGLEKSLLR